jgi:phage terminase Nu1 subunit (DNA packaging protein)
MNDTQPDLISAKQLAAHWGISRRGLDVFLKQGLPCLRMGKKLRRFQRAACDAWLAERYGSPATKPAA